MLSGKFKMASVVVSYKDLFLQSEGGAVTYALAVHPDIFDQCGRAIDEAFEVIAALGLVVPEATAAIGNGVAITTRRGRNTTAVDEEILCAASTSRLSDASLFSILKAAPPFLTNREKVRYLELVNANTSNPVSASKTPSDSGVYPQGSSMDTLNPTTASTEPTKTVDIPKSSSSKPNFEWNIDSTRLLLALFKDYKEDFAKPDRAKNSIWRDIATAMKQKGYLITGEMCDKKFRNMKVTTREIRDRMKRSGSGRITWRYYEEMRDIMDTDPAFSATNTVSTLHSAVDTTSESSSVPQQSQPSQPETPTTCALTSGVCKSLFPSSCKKRRTNKTSGAPAWFLEWSEKENEIAERRFNQLCDKQEECNNIQRERNQLLRDLGSLLRDSLRK